MKFTTCLNFVLGFGLILMILFIPVFLPELAVEANSSNSFDEELEAWTNEKVADMEAWENQLPVARVFPQSDTKFLITQPIELFMD
ncbi:MAG: hypothetical protein ACI9GH_000428 [Candidatus Paceibacteria bacterium]|jgi:hypothetical protein